MKVLLIKPKMSLNSIFAKEESIMPSPGLMYISSYLSSKSIDNVLIDFDVDKGTLLQVLDEIKPNVVGITCISKQLGQVVDMATKIKIWNPNVLVIIGGIHATVAGVPILKKFNCFDYAIRGDGEKPLYNILIGNIKSPGIVYKSKDGVIDQGVYHERGLDKLPFPNISMIDNKKYIDSPVYHRSEPHTFLITSRGCCFKCIFCNHSTKGGIRLRSAKSVLAELEGIYKLGYKDIRILDELFTFNKKRTILICHDLIRKKIKIQWNCQTRADFLDEEMIYWMKKAGCYNIQLGIEVGNPSSMEKIHKNLDLGKIGKVVQLLRKYKIFVIGFFMYGFPFETFKDWEDTIKFSKSIGLNMAISSMATAFPGTDLWNEKYKDKDMVDIGLLEKMGYYSTDSPKELKKILGKAVKSFYFRPVTAWNVIQEYLFHGGWRRRYRFFRLLVRYKEFG